ncbi:MAG: V-type ATP synthase subunit E family protein [Candidatus Micrarchaeota archaeon]
MEAAGLRNVQKKILEIARNESEAKTEKARAQANKALAEARAEAQAKAKELLGEAARKAELVKQGIEAEAKMKLKNSLGTAKNELLERVFEKALRELVAWKRGKHGKRDYEKWVLKKIREAARNKKGRVEIVLSAGDKQDKELAKKIREALAGAADVKIVYSPEFEGGVVTRLLDEKLEHNDSFEQKIEALKATEFVSVAKNLFGD